MVPRRMAPVGLAADGSPGKEILAILGWAVEVEYCTCGQVGGLYPSK